MTRAPIGAAWRPRVVDRDALCSWIVAITLAGCGRIHFDERADGGEPVDTSPRADACTFGPWSAPVALTALESSADDWGAWISPDKLDLMFGSSRTGVFQLYRSRRSSLADAFGAPTLVDLGIGGSQDDPFVTDDGLTLYFDLAPVAQQQLYVATRPSTSVEFANPVELTELNTGTATDSAPGLTSDELTIFFDSDRAGGSDPDIYMATRARVTDAFGPPTQIAELAHFGIDVAPIPSGDGQTLLFVSDRFTTGIMRIVQTTRSGAGFGAPTLLDPALSVGTASDTDPILSRDGTTLVFSSDRPGGMGTFDLYLATRSCQ